MSPGELLASTLAVLLMAASMWQWWRSPQLSFGPFLAGPRPVPSRWAMAAVVGWVVFLVALEVIGSGTVVSGEVDPQTVAVSRDPKAQIAAAIVLQLILLVLLLPMVLFDAGHVPAGLVPAQPRAEVADGARNYLRAVVPTIVALLILLPVRDTDSQHEFLKLLRESPDPLLIGLLALSAVLLAPASEELVFRVTLQSGLRERFGPRIAIAVTAVLFAAVHGWKDGLAILPLSLLLGLEYERRPSYLAACTTHGLFNGVMLLLAILSPGGPETPG